MMHWAKVVILFAIIVGAVTFPARADEIFDNYDDAFLAPETGEFGVLILGPDWLLWGDQAARFVVPIVGGGQGYFLTSVDLPLRRILLPDAGNSTSLSVSVFSNGAGMPGTPLESTTLNVSSTTPAIVTAVFSGSLALQAGETYWVVLIGISDSTHLWLVPDPMQDTGIRRARGFNNGPAWRSGLDDPAFRVEGNLIPTVPVHDTTWGWVKSLYRSSP